MSFKPENWKVEFKPEKIDQIEPNGLKQVEMIVTPTRLWSAITRSASRSTAKRPARPSSSGSA
jgi:hypothetical protein